MSTRSCAPLRTALRVSLARDRAAAEREDERLATRRAPARRAPRSRRNCLAALANSSGIVVRDTLPRSAVKVNELAARADVRARGRASSSPTPMKPTRAICRPRAFSDDSPLSRVRPGECARGRRGLGASAKSPIASPPNLPFAHHPRELPGDRGLGHDRERLDGRDVESARRAPRPASPVARSTERQRLHQRRQRLHRRRHPISSPIQLVTPRSPPA